MPTFTLPLPRITDEDWARFLEKIDPPNVDGCTLWTSTTTDGYGRFYLGGRMVYAHRVAFEYHNGPIPRGLELDHSFAKGCRSRLCVATAHLEAVTHAENTRRDHATRRWWASIQVRTELDEG